MSDLVDQIIAERRAVLDGPRPLRYTTDLLGRMLTGVDKQTGERLPDENIRAQCITFLIAGHETTSGLLSFALYYLMKNPDVLARARAEVDGVLGTTAAPAFEQVQRLTYVRQVLDESLRLWPTAPGFTRAPFQDTVIGGRYAIPAHTPMFVLSQALHHATSVWGPDAAEFNPDHTAPARMAALPPNAYKPFGTGQRACIGRQFALQEATLVLGMLLQRFEFVDHLRYQLKVKTTLTMKPDGFHIQVHPRADVHLDRAAPVAAAERSGRRRPAAAPAPLVARHGTPLSVLFGSNLGTAESIATRLAQEGTERGFAVTLGALDDHVDDLPRDGAALIVCSSYNGTPPDNAAAFCRWITRRRHRCRRRRRLHRLRLRQHGVGRHLPGRARPCSTSSSPHTAAAGSATAGRATPPATSTPPTATGTAASGPTSPPPSTCPPRWARPWLRPDRGCRSPSPTGRSPTR